MPMGVLSRGFKKLALFAVLAPACCQAQNSAPTHHIRGAVVTEDGMPVKGAVIAYDKAPKHVMVHEGKGMQMKFRRAPDDIEVSSTTASRADGGFDFPRPVKGYYRICASVPGTTLLDSCQWSGATVVNSADDADADLNAIVLRNGVQLRVRVEDPQNLLPRRNPLVAASNLIIGVLTGKGAFHAAAVASIDQLGRDFRLLIPKDEPLRLWVFSRHVRVADENGRIIDNLGATLPLGPLPATGELLIVLRVIGPAS
jgi:hypothetical protein